MTNFISIQKCLLLVFLTIFEFQGCNSTPDFTCPKNPTVPFPKLAEAFSTNIRINFIKEALSVEVREAVSGNKSSMEFWANKRHVKYISQGGKQLLLKYDEDGGVTCKVKSIPNWIELEDEDAGPNRTLGKLMEAFYEAAVDKKAFVYLNRTIENCVLVDRWEGCLKYPEINVSVSFSEKSWSHTFTSALHNNLRYVVSVDAQARGIFMTALYSNFSPLMPPDSEFQPPENVYCEGFQPVPAETRPTMTDAFTYDSEVIMYRSTMGIAPVIAHRTVFYDYPSGISRTDFYDPLAEDQDTFSEVSSSALSIIHDFKSGIQYDIDPLTGECTVDSFQIAVSPIGTVISDNNIMPTGLEFFSLNATKLEFNGQFSTRGYMANVYTALLQNPGEEKKYIYTWYFSTHRTQIVEKLNVEKDVLLRMVVRPEAAEGKDEEVDVNFYDFERTEPSVTTYDITNCYNESNSRMFVLTFPANDQLKGLEKTLKHNVHLALLKVAGVSKQRIFVSAVTFRGKYMHSLFKLLAPPSVLVQVQNSASEISLDAAVKGINDSVIASNFNVPVQVNDELIVLQLEPNGFNEFAGDRKVDKPGQVSNYKEGSVIGLTIGMLLLGFVLGGITLNLIVSRKYGVSLFQKKNVIKDPFNDGNRGESSM